MTTHCHRSIYLLKGLIAVPITVIRQLDGLKNSVNTDVAMKARRASRVLDEITARGDPVTGITMPNGSVFKLARKYTPIDTLGNMADNKIVGTAEALKKEADNTDVVTVLTTDVNMRIAARERGVKAEGSFFTEEEIARPKQIATAQTDIFDSFSVAMLKVVKAILVLLGIYGVSVLLVFTFF